MILYRCFAWNERAADDNPDGPLWFPREYQGDGRHDNPDLYGCLYMAELEMSCVVEQLARFRGQRLTEGLLRRRGLPLAVAAVEFDGTEWIDLDRAEVLRREELRPSEVATRNRGITQTYARRLFEQHPEAGGLRWWSTFESLWANVSVFDRAAANMRLLDISELNLDHPTVVAAAEHFAMRR